MLKKLSIFIFLLAGFAWSFSVSAATCPMDNGAGVGCNAGNNEYYCGSACRQLSAGTTPTLSHCQNNFQVCAPGVDCSNSYAAAYPCGVPQACNTNFTLCNIAGNGASSFPNSKCKTNSSIPAGCSTYNQCTNVCSACSAGYELLAGNCIGATVRLGTDSVMSDRLKNSTMPLMSILSSGNVGIGTTNPLDIFSIGMGGDSSPLGSEGTGHNNTMSYLSTDQYALINYGTVMTLLNAATSTSALWGGAIGGNVWNLNSGNVGIGTTSPSQMLTVGNNNQFTVTSGGTLTLSGLATPYTGNWLQFKYDTGSLHSSYGSENAWGGFVTNNYGINGDNRFTFGGTASSATGNTGVNKAWVRINALYNQTSGSFSNTDLLINRTETAITSGAQYLIDARVANTSKFSVTNTGQVYMNGNVGIGTTNPGARLDLGLGTGNPGNLRLSNYGFFGLNYSSGDLSMAYNAKANESSVSNMLVANTNGSVGYSFIKVGNGGIMFHTKDGAVTAGNVALNERMRIDGTGNVGIGTANPLDIFSIGTGGVSAPAGSDGTGHNNTMSYLSTDQYALVNYGTVKSIIASTTGLWGGTLNGNIWNGAAGVGNVGIGTTNPTSRLTVVSDETDNTVGTFGTKLSYSKTISADDGNQNAGLLVESATGGTANFTSSSNASIVGTNYNGTSGTVANQNASWFIVGDSANGAVGNVATRNGVLISNFSTRVGGLAGTVTNSNGLHVNNMAAYNAPVNTHGLLIDASTNAVGTYKYGIKIGDMSGATNNYAILTGLGKVSFGDNVGIGNTNPGSKLSVTDSSNGTATNVNIATLDNLGGAAGQSSSLVFTNSMYTGKASIQSYLMSGGGGADLHFNTSLSSGTLVDRMTILSNGNIGIGVTTPRQALEINGRLIIKSGANYGDIQRPDNSGLSIRVADGYNSLYGSAYFYNGGGAELMRIDGITGNVGIGTTAPNDIFSIGTGGVSAPAGSSGTGHNNSMSYLSTDQYALVNYGTVKSIIASTTGLWGGTLNGNIWNGAAGAGNVGIGMTAPTYGLQVQGGPTRGTALFDTGTSTSETQVVIRARTGTNGGYTNAPFQIRNLSDSIVAYIRQDGVVAGQTIQTADNNSVAFMQPAGAPAAGLSGLRLNSTTAISWSSGPSWWNTTDTGITRLAAGKIAIGNATAGDYTGTLITGNLGIGTTAPGAKLTIADTNKVIDSTGNLFIYSTDTATQNYGGQISLGGSWFGTSKTQFGTISGRKETVDSGSASGYLSFGTAGSSGGAINENMRITSTGNVGIGTTAPNDTFSIGNAGSAPIGSLATGHNFTMTYLPSVDDPYALVNYGWMMTVLNAATSSLPTYTQPMFATSTAATYNGSQGATYSGANALCSAVVSGSHVCTTGEIFNTINSGHTADIPVSTLWINNGPPGYTVNANDCIGWSSAKGTDYGTAWVKKVGNDGVGSLQACNNSRSYACCK